MAELTFVGAAGTVTGSKHLLTVGDKHLYVDCGMFQGSRDTVALNDAPLPIPAAQTDAIVLTHGHIDHVGYLPKIVHDGFHGPVYCTPATAGLLEIVLEDAAHLQQHMAQRGLEHERARHIPAFYDDDDVQATLKLLKTIDLETDFEVCGVPMRYHNAGHILGSAFIDARVEGKRVIFSGDLGRYGRPLLYDPTDLDTADVVVCESTYGDRLHPPDALGDLEKTLLAGIIDVRNSLLEEPRELAKFGWNLLEDLEGPKLHLVPNGDLQFVPEKIAREKVRRLGAAARILKDAATKEGTVT